MVSWVQNRDSMVGVSLQSKAVHVMVARKQRQKGTARKGDKLFPVSTPVTHLF